MRPANSVTSNNQSKIGWRILQEQNMKVLAFTVSNSRKLINKDLLCYNTAPAEALLISYAEHNGNCTVADKKLFDWASLKNREVCQGKPIVMMATSAGAGGAKDALSLAMKSARLFAGSVMASLYAPEFCKHSDRCEGVLTNLDMVAQLQATLSPPQPT